MTNLIHGFESLNSAINPDARLMQAQDLTNNDLCIADSFLRGEQALNPVKAHEIVKIIYTTGKFKYRTLFDKAESYVTGFEYDTLEKISKLSGSLL